MTLPRDSRPDDDAGATAVTPVPDTTTPDITTPDTTTRVTTTSSAPHVESTQRVDPPPYTPPPPAYTPPPPRASPRHDNTTAADRQRAQFGGIKWGSAFFGWLCGTGLAVLLLSLATAAGAVIGLTALDSTAEATDTAGDALANADTIGIVGGIVLLLILMLAYFAGGYVAGRMARFDGLRQGVAVWIVGLLITAALAALGAIAGAEYNILSTLNLPSIPVSGQDLTTGGLIALAAVLVGTLVAAIAGGKTGERYHRKVDRAGANA